MGEPQNDTPVTAVESGWDRIKRMYTGEGFEMEKDVCFRMGRTAFICGLVFGGLWTKNESTQRFQAYSAGKKFLGARDALRRKWDFGILMFIKNGTRMGLRAALLTGSVVALTTHTTVYRNKFSPVYFPIYSGLSAFLMHRALACGIFAFPLGLYGQIQAFSLGATTGTMLGGVTWLYALACDKSIPDAYQVFKNGYEENLKEASEEDLKVDRIMKDEKITIRYMAQRRLRQLEQEKLLKSAEENDT